ncbi:hypothetical protein VTI28DRAFT_9984 [Corynascus sepedonium]
MSGNADLNSGTELEQEDGDKVSIDDEATGSPGSAAHRSDAPGRIAAHSVVTKQERIHKKWKALKSGEFVDKGEIRTHAPFETTDS